MVLMSLVEDFLEKGKLLSPEVLEELDSLDDNLLKKLIENTDLVITKNDVKKLIIPKPKVVHLEYEKGGEVHISEFTQFYLDRFEFLKNEVKNRLDGANISSINNLSSGKSSVIGMVRKTGDGEVILEDKTGELTLKTDNGFINDEVVGVKGDVIKNKEVVMSPKKIVYPDVPIRKNVATLDKDLSALFVSKIDKDTKKRLGEIDPDYIFCTSDTDVEEMDIVHISDEPGELCDIDPLRCNIDDIRILVHNGESVKKAKDELNLGTKETLTALLKKRHLDPVEMHSLKDRYLIKEVPDIIHVSGEENTVTNYKGVTLISTNDKTAYLVNLKTREVEEVNI